MGAREETRFGRRAIAATLALALVLGARAGRADDTEALERGKTRLDGGQYEEAARRFALMLDPSQPPCDRAPAVTCRIVDAELIVSARAYYATTLIALKRVADADEQIEKLLRQDHAYRPSAAMFPPDVVDRFTEVRARLSPVFEAEARTQAEQELHKQLAVRAATVAQEKWVADLQRLAAQETVVEKSSRLVAMLPFGVGQFQNGEKGLGALFAVTEALAGAACLAAAGVEQSLASVNPQAQVMGQVPDATKLTGEINTAATVNRVAFGAWAALTIAGIVQGQVALVPERTTTRLRALPPAPPLVPTVAIVPGGGVVGLTGRF